MYPARREHRNAQVAPTADGSPVRLIGALSPSRLTRAPHALPGQPYRERSPASQAFAVISCPVALIDAASRELMKTPAPSAMSASARARPSPLLAAATTARRPPTPRSTATIVAGRLT